MRAAGGLHLLLELLLVIGLALGAHDDDRQLFVVIDAGDGVVGQQHVLVEQVAERQIFGMIADRHRGDDLLRIEEDRQRPLDHHRGLDRGAGLVDAFDPLGQAGIERIGANEIIVGGGIHAANVRQGMRRRKRWSAQQEARLAPGLRTLTYVACLWPGNISREGRQAPKSEE